MNNTDDPIRASMWLERALIFTFVIHGLAMVSMALLLLPGMPGGTSPSDSVRIGYIAANPWLWKLGWLPWQLTALSDVLLGIALLKTKWIPRISAFVALLLTLVAVAFEQPGEYWWTTEGIRLAQVAHSTSNLSIYLIPGAGIFTRVSAWAALFYSFAAIGWSWCFAQANTWSRTLTWLSVVAWSVLIAVAIGPLIPPPYTPRPELISAGNAIGFILLMLWFALVIEMVLRRSRPFTRYGREAVWRHPAGKPLGWCLDLVANSRLARYFGECLPSMAFVSDITDVCYVNYLVDAELLEPLVPWGLELNRIGVGKRQALFTFLTYNHGHFGPRILGPLRRLLPSPVQSNWRIHVCDPATGKQGIHFVTTALSATPNALAARLLSDGVPMHVPKHAAVRRQDNGTMNVVLDAGSGTAPSVTASLFPAQSSELPADWRSCFQTYRDFLAYCIPQDRAMSSLPWSGRICRHEIDLGILLDSCEPLDGTVQSATATEIVGDAKPVCFRVAQVNFLFAQTEYAQRCSIFRSHVTSLPHLAIRMHTERSL